MERDVVSSELEGGDERGELHALAAAAREPRLRLRHLNQERYDHLGRKFHCNSYSSVYLKFYDYLTI